MRKDFRTPRKPVVAKNQAEALAIKNTWALQDLTKAVRYLLAREKDRDRDTQELAAAIRSIRSQVTGRRPR